MGFGKKEIIAFALVFLATLLWATFFGLTGLSANDFFTLKLHIVLEKILTLNTLAFFVFLTLPIALIAVLAKRMEKISLIIAAETASLLALIIAFALFPQMQSLWATAILYLIAIPLAIEMATVQYNELTKWVALRVGLSAAGKTTMFVSIGLVLFCIITVLPEQGLYVQKFETFITDFAQGVTSGESNQSISSGMAGLVVQSQITIVDTLLQNAAFTKLRQKTDPDVIAFVAVSEATADGIKSPEYRQEITEKFSESSSGAIQEINIMELLKDQFPFIDIMEQFMWAIYAMAIAGIFSLAALIISKPMGALFAVIGEKIISLVEPEETEGNEQQMESNEQQYESK